MIESYSLEEVAAAHLPAHWKEPVRWLREQIRAGKVPGKRLSRGEYRMTTGQIRQWLEGDPPRQDVADEPVEPVQLLDGLSRRVRNRRLAS